MFSVPSKVAISCVLAVASAGIVSPIAYSSWVAPQHLPVIGPNGVPLDTPAVNAAKAQHFHAVAEAKVRNGDHFIHAAPITAYAAATPVVASGIAVTALATPVYQGPLHLPVIGPNGVPLDTPEVNAAKVSHFHDVAEAKLRNGDHLIHAPIAAYAAAPFAVAAPIHLPVIGPNGVPLDTPAVVSAKMAHFAAHANERTKHGHWIAKRSVVLAPQHLPVIGPNGVPLDTPAVNAAKAQHFHAVAEAKVRNGDHFIHAAPITAYAAATPVVSSGIAVTALATPVYQGPIHLPVIGPNGVPLDTPAVNAAKAQHFHSVAEAKVRNGDHFIHPAPITAYAAPTPVYQGPIHLPVIGPNGVPLDTPTVNAAKAQHFHSVAEAKVRNGDHFVHPAPITTYAAAPVAVSAPIHLPVIGPHGVPLDTPEVVSAKMAHFAAHARASHMAY